MLLWLLLAMILCVPSSVLPQECFESMIIKPTPFMGQDDEIFQLSDGSLWQVKYEYEYLYSYYPTVIICGTRGKLIIDEKTLNILPLTSGDEGTTAEVVESHIEGEFDGWEGDTIVALINGQIWEQVDSYYHYHYEYMPTVFIYNSESGYKMRVEGIDRSVLVRRLR